MDPTDARELDSTDAGLAPNRKYTIIKDDGRIEKLTSAQVIDILVEFTRANPNDFETEMTAADIEISTVHNGNRRSFSAKTKDAFSGTGFDYTENRVCTLIAESYGVARRHVRVDFSNKSGFPEQEPVFDHIEVTRQLFFRPTNTWPSGPTP
jgi:hypothetical protein